MFVAYRRTNRSASEVCPLESSRPPLLRELSDVHSGAEESTSRRKRSELRCRRALRAPIIASSERKHDAAPVVMEAPGEADGAEESSGSGGSLYAFLLALADLGHSLLQFLARQGPAVNAGRASGIWRETWSWPGRVASTRTRRLRAPPIGQTRKSSAAAEAALSTGRHSDVHETLKCSASDDEFACALRAGAAARLVDCSRGRWPECKISFTLDWPRTKRYFIQYGPWLRTPSMFFEGNLGHRLVVNTSN